MFTCIFFFFFFFQAEDGIRDKLVTGVQTCALPIFDVHRPARAEVAQPLLELGRAATVHASPVRFALRSEGDAAARRTARREPERLGARRALGRDDPDDVRDHIAGALDEDRVPDADVLLADLVLVVQADVTDHDTGELHRPELGDGREDAGPADADLDRLDHGRGLA